MVFMFLYSLQAYRPPDDRPFQITAFYTVEGSKLCGCKWCKGQKWTTGDQWYFMKKMTCLIWCLPARVMCSHVHPCAVVLIELCSICFIFETKRCNAPTAKHTGYCHQDGFGHTKHFPPSYPPFSALPKLHVLHLKKLHNSTSSGLIFPTHQSPSRDSIASSLHLHHHLGHWCWVIQLVINPPSYQGPKVDVTRFSGWNNGNISNCIQACSQAQNKLSVLLSHLWSLKIVLAHANLALLWSVPG